MYRPGQKIGSFPVVFLESHIRLDQTLKQLVAAFTHGCRRLHGRSPAQAAIACPRKADNVTCVTGLSKTVDSEDLFVAKNPGPLWEVT